MNETVTKVVFITGPFEYIEYIVQEIILFNNNVYISAVSTNIYTSRTTFM